MAHGVGHQNFLDTSKSVSKSSLTCPNEVIKKKKRGEIKLLIVDTSDTLQNLQQLFLNPLNMSSVMNYPSQ